MKDWGGKIMALYGVPFLFLVLSLPTKIVADSTTMVTEDIFSTTTPTFYVSSTTIVYQGPSSSASTTTLIPIVGSTAVVTAATTAAPYTLAASSATQKSASLTTVPTKGTDSSSSTVASAGSSSTGNTTVPAQGKTNAVAIGAGVGGGLGAIALLIGLFLCRRRSDKGKTATAVPVISAPIPRQPTSEPASSIALLGLSAPTMSTASSSNWNNERFDDGRSFATTRHSVAATMAPSMYAAPSIAVSGIGSTPPVPPRSPYRDTLSPPLNINRHRGNSTAELDEEIRKANARYIQGGNQGPGNTTSSGLNSNGRSMSPEPLNINKNANTDIPSIEYGRGEQMIRRGFADPQGPGPEQASTHHEDHDDVKSFTSVFSSQSIDRPHQKLQYDEYSYNREGAYRYEEDDDPNPNAYREEQRRADHDRYVQDQRRATEERLSGRWRGY